MDFFSILKAFLNPALICREYLTFWGGGKGGGGRSSAPAPTNQTVTQTNLPEYARPYFENLLNRAQALSYQGYQPYQGPRIAGFTPEQQRLQAETGALETPGEFDVAGAGMTGIGTLGMGAAGAGLGQALGYTPGMFSAPQINVLGARGAEMAAATSGYSPNLIGYQMRGAEDIMAPTLQSYGMQAAKTGFSPDITTYQMEGPERVSTSSVGTELFGQGAADYYMSPFAEKALAPAIREARLQGNLQKQAGMLGAIGRGTFGGARQALLQAEQERGTQRNISDIMTTGMERAYQNAQQAFQADQARALQAQQLNQAAMLQAGLANQQAGLTTAQQNLAAQQAAQQLRVGTGTQLTLANLSNEQQAQVQNLAAQLQTQGLNAQQALQAALANQQAIMTSQQQREQARQYGAGLGAQLFGQGLGSAQQAAAGLGALGATRQQADVQRLQAQQATAAQQQELAQNQMDIAYQDFLRQRDYPQEMLGFYNQMLRGLPVQLASTQQTYQAAPNLATQIGGLGIGALSLSKLLG